LRTRPRGMNCDRACAYVGISKSKFLELVEDGHLPQPKNIGGLARWDRLDLDAAFDAAEEKRLGGTRVTMDELMAKNSWDDFLTSKPDAPPPRTRSRGGRRSTTA
jgi:excisionase family DNA binding protein